MRVTDLRWMLKPPDWDDLLRPALVHLVGLLDRQIDGLVELNELAWSQVSPRAKRDASQRQWADPHAAQFHDVNPDRFHHHANNMIETFVNDDLDDDALWSLAEESTFIRHDDAALHKNSVPKRLQLAVIGLLVGDNVVLLCQPVSGMHNPVSDFSNIRQEDDTLRLSVKPSYRIDAFLDIDEVHHSPSLLFVGDRGDEAAWLVEDNESRSLAPNCLAVDPDFVTDWIHSGAQLCDHTAVDLNTPVGDQLLGCTPGCHAPLRENALKSVALTLLFVTVVIIVPVSLAHAAASLDSSAAADPACVSGKVPTRVSP